MPAVVFLITILIPALVIAKSVTETFKQKQTPSPAIAEYIETKIINPEPIKGNPQSLALREGMTLYYPPVVKTQPRLSTQAKRPIVRVTDKGLPDDNVCVVAGKKYFPASEWAVMKAVIMGESTGRPEAHNSNRYYGCFQIDNGPVYVPDTNAKLAYDKFVASKRRTGNGWLPWEVYTSGSYLKWLSS